MPCRGAEIGTRDLMIRSILAVLAVTGYMDTD